MNTFYRQGVALIAATMLFVPSVSFAQSGGAGTPRPAAATQPTGGARFTLDENTTGLKAAGSGTGLANVCPSGSGADCLASIIGRIINVVLGFDGLILLGFLIYGGLLWMTSGGDVDGVKKAKTMIQNAVIGILITSLSYAIASFVLTNLISSLTGTPPPAATGASGATPPPASP